MASPVSICSNALILLGDKPIASFTDGSKAAQVAANLYPDAKRDFLRGHPWNAAIKRATLAPMLVAMASAANTPCGMANAKYGAISSRADSRPDRAARRTLHAVRKTFFQEAPSLII